MYQSLALFQTAHDMARHAGARQATTARNVANADTPGYQARQIAPFTETYAKEAASTMRATRPGHLSFDPDPARPMAGNGDAEPSPNGNAVSIEEEMMNAVNIAREHNRALTIYRHTMTVLRTSLGR
ncbi:FlgB family protein [Yoonia sp. R2331]|uniref:FlgB family protein n=1 Tax=Yoonia sp. R2331 TaxID=3237238 RepID=UPI0034E40D0F